MDQTEYNDLISKPWIWTVKEQVEKMHPIIKKSIDGIREEIRKNADLVSTHRKKRDDNFSTIEACIKTLDHLYLRRILKVYDELSKSGIEEKDIISPAYWNKRIDDKNRIYKNASVFVSASMDALSQLVEFGK